MNDTLINTLRKSDAHVAARPAGMSTEPSWMCGILRMYTGVSSTSTYPVLVDI